MLTLFSGSILYAQLPDSLPVNPQPPRLVQDGETFVQDTTPQSDTIINQLQALNDSLFHASDSINNGVRKRKGAASEIDDLVNYDAVDSLVFSMDTGRVELYNEAIISYEDITLQAGYIRYDMSISEVFATGIPDSTGKIIQKPVFKQGKDSYNLDTIRYNFKTQRAFIKHVVTEAEGGFLHSNETKRQKNGYIHIKDGIYTTCNADHPHFGVVITKGISMPNDKIVSGPVYLTVADIPLPIGLPFSFFPNSRTKTSGILLPQYGEEERRGFYMRDGGYYFALNDYFDLRLTGDVYSNGTWGLRGASSYKLRYKFNGSVNLQFFQNISGYKAIESDYSKSKDYSISWTHAQAREANPNRSFRASVNLSSSTYDKNQTQRIENIVNSTKQSSISYTKSWPNSPFNLSASLNHSQNNSNNSVNMTLPKVAFNMGRINPFERKKAVGPKRWYEDIQLSYTSLLENRIKTTDTMLFTSSVWDDMTNGFRHEIPLSLNIKPFKKSAALQTFTITPNVSYKGMIYSKQKEYYISGYDEDNAAVIEDTLYNKLSYAHAYLPRVSAGISPKIYGNFEFLGDGRLEAVRHVMTPSASFSYVPDMTAIQPDYYRDLYDSVNNEVIKTYSIYEDEIYGTPTFNGASGSVSLSLRNTLEAKVRAKNDTIDKVEKVKLLDNVNLSTSYNIFNRDTLSPSWTPVSLSGSTRLFKNKLNLTFRGTMDPFGYSDSRNRVTETYFNQTGKLARLTSASVSMGMSFSSKKGEKDGEEELDEDDPMMTGFDNTGINDPNSGYIPSRDDFSSGYVDFDVPWNLRVDYTLSYNKPRDVTTIVQTVRASGDLSLTPKWKIQFSTGYDIAGRKVTMTNLSLRRDLHCWQMSISVVPFGTYKSYNFTINARSAILSDLKYNKRKSWQDNF